MKRDITEIVTVDGKQYKRITTADERWYARQVSVDGTESNKRWDFVPSVTWICDHYPKGVGFYKWLASKGWSEAEEIKALAGDKGSKVHQAIARLVAGGSLDVSVDTFENPRSLKQELLDEEENLCLQTFCEWFEEEQPQVIVSEHTVWNEKYHYAGTLDLMCRLKSTDYKYAHLIDIKTSLNIWPSMEIQLSAYKKAMTGWDSAYKNIHLGILQVGYTKNRKKLWKYTPVADQFSLFMAAYRIWKKECAGIKPYQRDYPMHFSLSSQIKAQEAQPVRMLVNGLDGCGCSSRTPASEGMR